MKVAFNGRAGNCTLLIAAAQKTMHSNCNSLHLYTDISFFLIFPPFFPKGQALRWCLFLTTALSLDWTTCRITGETGRARRLQMAGEMEGGLSRPQQSCPAATGDSQ